MEKTSKTKINKKKISPITYDDILSYSLDSENLSPNIRALPIKKRLDPKKDFRPIEIEQEIAATQKKLNISGIEVIFPYEPYPIQKIYMEKVIEACQKNTIAGLESPTGTGKTLCLLCASLAYLRHERQRLINERNNNFDVVDKTEKIKQPVIYYTSRTHAQLANVIQELQKTCYRPINAIISSREQMCVNELFKGFSGSSLTMKCQFAQKKNQCRYFKGKNKSEMTWGAYDGKTIEELKTIAKKAKFCPFFFERDKSVHSDMIFLPYNYIFDPAIKKRMNIQMKNSILIVDEAHNIQEVCNDSVSKDFDTNTAEDILNDLKHFKIFLEENQVGGLNDMEFRGGNEKSSNKNKCEAINIDQLKYEINILNNITIALNKLENVRSGKNWGEYGRILDTKELFDLFYIGSKGDNQKQTTIKINNKDSINNKSKFESNNKINGKKNKPQTSEKTRKSNSDISYDEEEENNSEEEIDIDNEQIEQELTPFNISTHINYLSAYEFFIHNDRGKRTQLNKYIEVLELLKLLGDNYIEIENSDDSNPLHNYTNNFRFFVEDVTENKSLNTNYKRKSITSFVSKKRNRTLHIYCFNPGFGFKNVIKEKLHATIITSGTLSPIDGMESELKFSFGVKLEGKHIIDKKQIHFGILTQDLFGDKKDFVFNRNTRKENDMIIDLGNIIFELCKVTPGGILVFFSSYNVMEDTIKIWQNKKIISKISKYKEFCQDKHDQQLNKKVLEIYQKANSSPENKGAILFSVCRGSCSEGMNFKDDAARLVIVVGIPFAYLGDPRTQLRKEYQDDFNRLYFAFIKEKNIKKLSGSEWYSLNAIKCVNQALGRVIRHSNDYGCMLLVDSRYQYNSNKCLISKWISEQVIIYNKNNNHRLISNVESFFKDAKNFTDKKKEEQKKLDSMKSINQKKDQQKKIKNNNGRNLKVINDFDEQLNEEEKKYEEDIIRNSIKKIKNKKFQRINDDQHFNIIDDIKIDEIKNSSNNNRKERLKKKKKEQSSNKSNLLSNSNNSNHKDIFFGNDFDLEAIFGDDIRINGSEKNQNNNQENNININLSTIKKQEESSKDEININFSTNKKKMNSNNDENILNELFDEVGISFFDNLEDQKNSTIKKEKPNINNLKNENITKVEEEIKEENNNNNFNKELEKSGLKYTLDNSQNSDSSNGGIRNELHCPECHRNTNEKNVQMMVLSCCHFICKDCLEKFKLSKIQICPIYNCKTKINFNTARIFYA